MNALHRCRRPALAGLLLVGTLSTAACGDDRAAVRVETGGGGDAVVDTAALQDGIFVAGGEDESPPPVIYYDLTRYDWYARGEPLQHDGRSFMPGGLVAASGAEMEQLGDYGGVAFYRRAGAPADSLFVPVYERYWLSFLPQAPTETG
jgi:hypothetical protein